MVRRCFVCDDIRTPDNPIVIHEFPSDNEVRSLWLKACKLPETVDISRLFICSSHFHENDYVEWGHKAGKFRLKKGAVPFTSSSLSLKDSCVKNKTNTVYRKSTLNVTGVFIDPSGSMTFSRNTEHADINLDNPNVDPEDDDCQIISVKRKDRDNPSSAEFATEQIPENPPKKRFNPSTYIEDLTIEDFKRTESARINLELLKITIRRKNSTIQKLQQQNTNLQEKVETLEELLQNKTQNI